VTAVSLIKQSKIANDDRCRILISSLQDTLHGIELKSYGTKYNLVLLELAVAGLSLAYPRPHELTVSSQKIFTTRCSRVESAILRSHVVCQSVTLVDHDHIG